MEIKNGVVVERIQREVGNDNVKYAVLGPGRSGMIKEFFGKDATDKGYHIVNMIDTISIHVRLELLMNRYNEKIRIIPTPEGFIRQGENELYRDFMNKHDIIRADFKNRVAIIMGLSISALLPDSKFALYIGNEYKKNIFYTWLGSTIVASLPVDIYSSEDDINKRISAVFNYLWFNDVNDYTGYDKEIVEFSLRNWDKIR